MVKCSSCGSLIPDSHLTHSIKVKDSTVASMDRQIEAEEKAFEAKIAAEEKAIDDEEKKRDYYLELRDNPPDKDRLLGLEPPYLRRQRARMTSAGMSDDEQIERQQQGIDRFFGAVGGGILKYGGKAVGAVSSEAKKLGGEVKQAEERVATSSGIPQELEETKKQLGEVERLKEQKLGRKIGETLQPLRNAILKTEQRKKEIALRKIEEEQEKAKADRIAKQKEEDLKAQISIEKQPLPLFDEKKKTSFGGKSLF